MPVKYMLKTLSALIVNGQAQRKAVSPNPRSSVDGRSTNTIHLQTNSVIESFGRLDQ